MRILEINTEKSWRGGERQTLYALMGFRDAGHEVELLCFKNSPLHKRASEAGFVCHTITSNYKSIFFLLTYGKTYSIIHTQTSKQLTFCVLTKPFHKTKLFFSRRVDFVPKGFFTLKKYNQCNGIICVSEAIQTILKNAGVTTNTIVISDCIVAKELNVQRARQFTKDLSIDDKIIIGTTAALVEHKDPITLVKAMRVLCSSRKDVVLIHFGDGPLENEMHTLIRKYALEDYYKLAGFKDNVEDFFSIFHYFVMSSQEEGLGSSVLDAFVYHVPVVSTNAGGLEALVTGRGYLAPKKNPELLAETLQKALTDVEGNRVYTEAAANFAIHELSIRNIHDQYIRFFNQ